MASPGGVQAGRLAPGLENPILEAGPNYYIFLYAPYTARTHFGSGGYGTTLGGSGDLPAWSLGLGLGLGLLCLSLSRETVSGFERFNLQKLVFFDVHVSQP